MQKADQSETVKTSMYIIDEPEIADITQFAKWAAALIGKSIKFLVDSERAFKAPRCVNTKSLSPKTSKKGNNRQSRQNKANITWIPSQAGVECYEKADELASAGDVVTYDCLRPFSVFECCLKQWTMEEHLRR